MRAGARQSPQCSALLSQVDWGATSLGPYESWPQSLKSFVSMVLEMPTPAILFWGADQIQLYNDGYGVIMGPRHPTFFGAPYRECWPDTYPVIYPWMQRVLQGEVIEVQNTLFTLTRHGFTEEAYFTFTFSPLRDDTGQIAGVFQPVVEVTQEVLGARRAELLRALTTAVDASGSPGELLALLATNPKDVPFAALYGVDKARQLRLEATVAIELDTSIPGCVAQAFASGESALVAMDAITRDHIGTWDESTRQAYVLPLSDDPVHHGVLVLGVSPRLRFDDAYRDLFGSVGRHIGAALDRLARARAQAVLQQEAELARSELEHERRQLQAVFMEAPVAVTILAGPSYIVELANPLVCAIWGRDPADVHGRPLFEAMPELVGQGLEAILDEVRKTREPFIGTEMLVRVRRAPDAHIEDRYFNFVYHPMVAASGLVPAVAVVANDVTSHVLARQAAEQLARDLDAARLEAEVARDDAQRANRAKDEFLAMLGHELRNPLAPIFTALDLIQMRGGLAATSRETAVIERQAHHLAGLVDDLLDVSRITSGKIELKRHLLGLDELIAKSIETASPLFEKRRHELHVDIHRDLIVLGDSTRLTQVFANLLTNAAKYTDPGGRIEVSARRSGGDIVVEIRDNGRGISLEMLPRIFDLFAQESQNLDRAQGGLGLGLAIVNSIVTMHGGDVEAQSDGPGQGSTFVVRLPAALALPEPRPVTESDQTPVFCERRVLIVDDNEDAATLLAESLSQLGYSCAVAHDGPKAIEVARREAFDAVLLDIGLPAMDGYEVARHLRAMPGWDRTRLVAISGYGQHSDQQRSLEAGFDYHFVKPVDMSALTRALGAGANA